MTLDWTGERYQPDAPGAQIHYEHLHRYAFASLFIQGKKVLDMASGEGYGSFILSIGAKSVTGIDIDERSIEHAKRKYTSEKLCFLAGSIEKVPIEGKGIFDVVVCFEAIEHIIEHDRLMYEVKRLLKEDGLFIISTPDKQKHLDAGIVNSFHVKELYFEEFVDLLNNHFRNVNIWGQKVFPSSYIWKYYNSDDMPVKFFNLKKNAEFYFAESRERLPMFFIAVASDFSIKANFESILIDVDCLLINELNELIAKLNELIAKKDAYINYTLNSWSWKITAPLRWLRTKVKLISFVLISPIAVFVLVFWIILLLAMVVPFGKEKH